MKELLKKLEGKLPENEIVKDADMKRYTSFKAGGKADVLVMPETQEELMYLLQAVNAAYDNGKWYKYSSQGWRL